MNVDLQTLHDLEVVPTGRRSGDLLAHLDRTSTKGGGRAWKRRLTRPLGTVEEIREVQDAIRFILSNRGLCGQLPTESEVQAVDRYLRSNFATVRSRRLPTLLVESALVRLRYPEPYREALAGRAALGIVWRQMAALARDLSEGPSLLAAMAREIESTGGTELVSQLMGDQNGTGRRSWARVLAGDRMAREEIRDSLARLLDLAYELDALCSMAIVTDEFGFCFPEVRGGDPRLEARGVWHPFLENPVPTDLSFGPEGRLMFLTGPNMAGKSTYLKGCGITVLLAHVGMGVPATSCTLGLAKRLVCALRTEDSLWHGVSYFQAEARRVRSIAEWISLEERCVVLVDELFRGTNVKDAADATEAVMRGFSRSRHGLFLISSHLIEVAARIQGLPGVVVRHFEAHLEGGEFTFSYRVKEGVSDQRLGMEVLRAQGVLTALQRIG